MLSLNFAPMLVGAALLIAPPEAQPIGQTTSAAPAPAAEASADRKLFALMLRPGAAWKPGRPFAEQGLRDHFHYWMGLFRQGSIATAGPVGNDSGLVLLFARDAADAERIMRADPAIAARIFTGEIGPYAPPMVNGSLLQPKSGAR